MMANKKVLVTSKGVYAVADGKTIELPLNSEQSIPADQAEKLVGRGRVELINNSKKSKDE